MLQERFKIMVQGSDQRLEVQARIPVALAAVHNFIRIHDPTDLNSEAEIKAALAKRDERLRTDLRTAIAAGYNPNAAATSSSAISSQEKAQAEVAREALAQRMWVDYQDVLRRRAEVE